MAKVTNLDDLKRMHGRARISKPGSKEWIEFATTMIDSFPDLYDTAKAMNTRMQEILIGCSGAPSDCERNEGYGCECTP